MSAVSPESPPAVLMKGVVKRFPGVIANEGIDFRILRGEIHSLLGENGAGKTTTVSMLTTALTPSEGTAKVHGHDIIQDPYGARENTGVVPENSNVYVDLSAWDNLMFSGELYGISRHRRESHAEELLETLGLYDKRKTRSREFSKGMRRRLTIAMALIHNPSVLFLDEPTSGLDVQSSTLIRQLLRQLNKEGVTIFLSTHQMEEANQLCDRVAIIDHGRIAAIDTPERLRSTLKSVQSVVVAFANSGETVHDELENLDGVLEVQKEGDKFKLFSEDPGALVPIVADYARDNDLKLISLNCLGPSLEDVFIKITGLDVEIGKGGK